MPDCLVEKDGNGLGVAAEHFGIVRDDSVNTVAVIFNDTQQTKNHKYYCYWPLVCEYKQQIIDLDTL